MRQIYSLFMQSLWGFDIRLLNEVRLFPLFSIFPNSLDSVRIINFLNFKTKKRLPGSGSRWCYKIHWAHLLPQTNWIYNTQGTMRSERNPETEWFLHIGQMRKNYIKTGRENLAIKPTLATTGRNFILLDFPWGVKGLDATSRASVFKTPTWEMGPQNI